MPELIKVSLLNLWFRLYRAASILTRPFIHTVKWISYPADRRESTDPKSRDCYVVGVNFLFYFIPYYLGSTR